MQMTKAGTITVRSGLFCILLVATDLSHAAPDLLVEGVRLPAWVIRDGNRQPLALAATLKKNDQISTGNSARVLLRLGDGSMVKLGENANLEVSDLLQRPQDRFIAATLKVLEGAFRFTTGTSVKYRTRREINVRFPTLTAGIRGTDIWGKKLGDREVIVLIEGKITVTRAGDRPVQMNDALTYLQAPKSGATTIAAVLKDQLKAWAEETELGEAHGSLRKGGRWKLYIGSYREQLEALSLYDSLRREGYPVRVLPQQTEDGNRYRLRLAGFPTEQDAEAVGMRLKAFNPNIESVASLQ
jgi:hypothetical protein